jgi:hypothetical protein
MLLQSRFHTPSPRTAVLPPSRPCPPRCFRKHHLRAFVVDTPDVEKVNASKQWILVPHHKVGRRNCVVVVWAVSCHGPCCTPLTQLVKPPDFIEPDPLSDASSALEIRSASSAAPWHELPRFGLAGPASPGLDGNATAAPRLLTFSDNCLASNVRNRHHGS